MTSDKKVWGVPASALLGAVYAQIGLSLGAIGGKDSMSGTFEHIHVPPTLISFALAPAKASRLISNVLKGGEKVWRLPVPKDGQYVPDFEKLKALYREVYKNIANGNITFATVAENGGAGAAVVKSALGNGVGFGFVQSADELYTECYGDLLVSLQDETAFSAEIEKEYIGIANDSGKFTCGGESVSMEEAVKDAQFIQESGPERLPIKHSMLAEIEKYAPVDAIVATSASGLPLGQITEHAVHPERCVGGHPYNPPHLIPLVEITKTEKTDEANVELAKEFYESLGKEAIVLKKDCPGYICNRLQLAVFREMVDLVERGVCTVEEADKALTFGPAIRWAIFGHNMIMQLGNKDGLKGMMDMLAGGFNLCADIAAWDTIPADYGTKAQKEMDEIMKNLPDEVGHTNAEIAQYRDKMLIDILKLHHKF